MRLSILFFQLFIFSIHVQAQPAFQRLYIGSGGGQLIEMSDGNLLTRITQQNGISIMNPEGQIIYSRSYMIDSLIGIIAVRVYTDSDLCFVSGYRKDSCSHSGSFTTPFTYPAIGKMDIEGNVLDLYHYRLGGSDCWGYPMDLLVSSTKDIITWGLAPAFFALKVDSTMTPVW